jgi:endoglucanase
LRELLEARGPSGYESAPAAAWRAAASRFAEVDIDPVGTPLALVARRKGARGPSRRLLVMGHIDEIGLIVTHIDDEGFLWFRGVGGWDAQVLVGQRLVLDTREGPVTGVVGRKPIHLLRGDDAKKVAELRDMHIDIGAAGGDDARSRVAVGDVAVIAAEPLELSGGRLVSRSLDNRLGCYVAYRTLQLLKEDGGAPGDVFAVAVAQEETTFQGAATTAYSLRPGVVLVIDVTHETNAPGVEEKENGRHPFGSGPAIMRGSNLSPKVFELLREAAEAEEIPYTVEASGRATGTDADAVTMSRAGVPTGSIGIPLRYMHSPVEMVHLEDVEATARLCAAFARRLTREVSFKR